MVRRPSITDSIRRAKSSASMREHVPRELCSGLWHMTHLDRFQSIFAGGSILPEPNIPDSDRWKTSQGKDHYPYVRTLGGVSLFDFDQFDAHRYRKEYSIFAGGSILPDPNIPDSDRWKTSQGKDHYPYVRTLGGVRVVIFAL